MLEQELLRKWRLENKHDLVLLPTVQLSPAEAYSTNCAEPYFLWTPLETPAFVLQML